MEGITEVPNIKTKQTQRQYEKESISPAGWIAGES